VSGAKKADEKTDAEIKAMKRAGLIECQSCKTRMYQDGSDDPGVSFKAPGHISAAGSAAAVMSHELEHVTHETAKADREDRQVTGQSVSLTYSVCPECGRSYVSGGVTRTTTSGKAPDSFEKNYQDLMGSSFGKVIDTWI
jgi:ribosomal protein L32